MPPVTKDRQFTAGAADRAEADIVRAPVAETAVAPTEAERRSAAPGEPGGGPAAVSGPTVPPIGGARTSEELERLCLDEHARQNAPEK